MGESDESLFWTENEEDGYHYFEPNEAINDEEESGAKRIRLSPEFNHQVCRERPWLSRIGIRNRNRNHA